MPTARGTRRTIAAAAALLAGLALAAPAAAQPPTSVDDEAAWMGTAAALGAGNAALAALEGAVASASASTSASSAASDDETYGITIPAGTSGPWAGWESGAAGDGTTDGSMGEARGEDLAIVGIWGDSTEESQTYVSSLGDYADFDGSMDVAVGALVTGETWEKAAEGAYVDRWTTAVKTIAAAREGKGTTYIRPAHEMNGNWMTWGVDSTNLEAFKKGFRLYAQVIRTYFPEAKIVFSPNSGNHTDVTIDQLWPGDDAVDVIGIDYYDGYPEFTSAAVWQSELYAMTGKSPRGIGAWQQYAEAKGKPLALSEWGLQTSDNTLFIQNVHDFMSEHAASPGSTDVAGKFVYDVYFNIEYNGNDVFKIYGGPNTEAEALYDSLTWGNTE